MKRIFLYFIFLLQVPEGHSQQDSIFRFVKDFQGPITNFSVDNLGNLYLVYQNGQLKKIRPDGDSVAVFNNVRRFGKLHSIDVSNPLKVLLYYRDFSTIVILDRLLNERSTLDLRKQQLLQIKAIGQSYDNNIWVFDALEAKLKKIGDDGRLIDQSNDFRTVFDSTPSPEHIIDQEKQVYLYDPLKGIYSFDYYGGFRERIPFTGWSDFRVMNHSVFGRDDNFLYRYDEASLQLQRYPVPAFMRPAQKIILSTGTVYVLRDGVLMVYSYIK